MPRSVRIDRPQPTYHQGFARSAGESDHPELWKWLIAAWSMGLGSTGGSVFDVSSQKRNGTWEGTGSNWAVSDGRYAGQFSPGANSAVNIGDFDIFPPLTIAFWGLSRSLSGSAEKTWYGKRNGGTAGVVIGIDQNAQGNKSRFYYASGGFQLWRTTTQPLTIDVWQHQAWVYDGSTDPVLYVDGVSHATTYDLGSAYPAVLGTADDAKIGNLVSPADEDLDGEMDDLFIYDRVLSSSAIRKLHTIGRGGIFQRKPIVVGKTPAVGTILPQIISAYHRINA